MTGGAQVASSNDVRPVSFPPVSRHQKVFRSLTLRDRHQDRRVASCHPDLRACTPMCVGTRDAQLAAVWRCTATNWRLSAPPRRRDSPFPLFGAHIGLSGDVVGVELS